MRCVQRMTFSESLIIYLSLGAPVAVYYLQREIHFPRPTHAARFVLAFVLWPATLLRILSAGDAPRARDIFAVNATADAENDQLIQEIFELARLDLDQTGRGQETAQFREMLERYAGLLSAAGSGEAVSEHLAEFYKAAGNPNPELAAICQSRRARAKLDLHARAVAAEVRHFFERLQISDDMRAAVAALAINLEDETTARLLGVDPDFTDGVSVTARHSQFGRERAEPARAA